MERLDLLGFYRFDDPGVSQRARYSAVSNGWFFCEPTVRGPYHADAEGLTEGDVDDTRLHKNGLRIQVVFRAARCPLPEGSHQFHAGPAVRQSAVA